MNIQRIDRFLIGSAERYSVPLARFAFFLVFFWFGILKVLMLSPANPLVSRLLDATLPFLSFEQFNVAFGLFEMLIGVLFLLPKAGRVVIPLFLFHMLTTSLPLFLLPEIAWQAPFVPTLEGQYILKNIALVALAVAVVARMPRLEDQSSRLR